VLIGRAGGYLLGVFRGEPPRPEVATPGKHRIPNLKTRRLTFDRRDITKVKGIRVVTAPCALVLLAAELDSYQYHHTRYAWEQDRQREREAYAREDAYRRYTWSDVFAESDLMLRELRGLLGTPARARPAAVAAPLG
jgi:hypothetical protein